MKKITYKNRPIGSIYSLAKMLSLQPKQLLDLANKANEYYRPNKPEIKPNGGIRQTYRVLPRLSIVQARITKRIFHNVIFPDYLQGGVKDKLNPRDYIKNASLHVHQKAIIKEDIANFFPSIQDTYVLKMWKYCFHFPDEVSEVLTKLTTFNGCVPQGAHTSSYIANLIFWDKEPQLEAELAQKGFIYSRLVDDISVSSANKINKEDSQFIISLIYKMLFNKAVKPKRKKHSIQLASHRMTIHRLNVNSSAPTMARKDRQKIWASIKKCEIMAISDSKSNDYELFFNKTRGRVAILTRLHPRTGKKYINRLRVIAPTT